MENGNMNQHQTNRSCTTLLGNAGTRWGLFVVAILFTVPASAQITAPRVLSAETDSTARLEERLINRLHATTDTQAEYIRYIVQLVEQEKLELRLVVAIEQYAIRRNRRYAFPFFERALRYEAAKRGVALTSVRHFQSTANPIRQTSSTTIR
ncbi:signal peptide protein [Rhodopirellula sallentina SM41]|uniref:Signal peptide protein n=2 Tax=Rhodopirellula TaxID=265488 RepID=M5TRJ7_9BACT|nr:signal peptide protein [Rhodopirellula sallentina SM41]